MDWNQIIVLLLSILQEQGPKLVAMLFEWLKGKFSASELTFSAFAESGATGTLEEFSQAVQIRLTHLIGTIKRPLVRAALQMAVNRLTDTVLQQLYDVVVKGVAMESPPDLVWCDDELVEFLTAADVEVQ